MGKLPTGVDGVVEIVSMEEQLGLHDGADKLALAPEGKPDTAKLTVCALPETRVAVRFVEPLVPPVTAMSPEIEKLKSKMLAEFPELENHALAGALGLMLFLKAIALTNVLLDNVKAFL
jgi:hypothetical protein